MFVLMPSHFTDDSTIAHVIFWRASHKTVILQFSAWAAFATLATSCCMLIPDASQDVSLNNVLLHQASAANMGKPEMELLKGQITVHHPVVATALVTLEQSVIPASSPEPAQPSEVSYHSPQHRSKACNRSVAQLYVSCQLLTQIDLASVILQSTSYLWLQVDEQKRCQGQC